MPERNQLSRKQQAWTLSKAATTHQLVKVSCGHCRIVRHYLPADLLELCPDIGLEQLPGHFRCETCHLRDYIGVDYYSPIASDTAKITIRRLVKVKTIRRPVWRDEVY